MEFQDSIKKLRESSKKRNFTQSADLFVNFSIDKKRKLNVSGNLTLPHGKGKAGRVCIFSDTMTTKAKELDVDIITKADLAKLDKESGKNLPDKYDSFFAETSLMLEIGKRLGTILAPKGKMPKPFVAGANLKELLSSGQNTFPITINKNVIHLTVGREDFDDSMLSDNLISVITFLDKTLPKGKSQIKSAYLKFTMSPSIKVI